MSTHEEIDALSQELNKPFSSDELSLYLTDRPLNSVCEKMHLHNLALLACLNDWQAHLKGAQPEPKTKIWKALRPGHNSENEACTLLENLIDIAVSYGHGRVPFLKSLVCVSRSTTTLVDRLDALYHTSHIDTMDAMAKDAFALLTYRGSQTMPSEGFTAELTRIKDEFVKACADNATELHNHVLSLQPVKQANVGQETCYSFSFDLSLPKKRENIVKFVTEEAKKTRRCVMAAAKRTVREIKTNAQSEYEKRGPSSSARANQFHAVIERIAEYKTNPEKLPNALQGKSPAVWIHHACNESWQKIDGGYPNAESLYVYCHRNKDKLLSLANC